MATLGQMMREARTARGLSLRELGALSGIHWANLSKIEHGRLVPSPQRLRSLCALLGVDEDAAIRASFEARIARQEAGAA